MAEPRPAVALHRMGAVAQAPRPLASARAAVRQAAFEGPRRRARRGGHRCSHPLDGARVAERTAGRLSAGRQVQPRLRPGAHHPDTRRLGRGPEGRAALARCALRPLARRMALPGGRADPASRTVHRAGGRQPAARLQGLRVRRARGSRPAARRARRAPSLDAVRPVVEGAQRRPASQRAAGQSGAHAGRGRTTGGGP